MLTWPATSLSAAALALLVFVLCRALLWAVKRQTTCLADLADLRRPVAGRAKLEGTAVCVGGSIAALIAARVLAEHYERVLVLDDELGVPARNSAAADAAQPLVARPNVFQHGYVHVVMALALRVHRALFGAEAFDKAALAADGRLEGGDGVWTSFNGKLFVPSNAVEFLAMSRAGLETLDRRLLLEQCDNVEILHAKALDIVVEGNVIVGVIARRATDGTVETLPASLVVDVSGAARVGVKWLKRHGYGEPPVEAYDIQTTYVNVKFAMPSDEVWRALPLPRAPDATAWFGLHVDYTDPEKYAFTVGRLESNTVACVFASAGDHLPPVRSADDALAAVQASKAPREFRDDLFPALVKACGEPRIDSRRLPPFSRVGWDRLPRLPSNFLALGDSTVRLNPINGQGITQVCSQAVTLDACLRRVRSTGATRLPAGFSRDCMRLVMSRADGFHTGNKLGDYCQPTTIPVPGEALLTAPPFALRHFLRVAAAASWSTAACDAYWRVVHGVAPSYALFSPGVLVALLYDACRSSVKL